MAEYDPNFAQMICAYDRTKDATVHFGGLRDGTVLIESRKTIEVPIKDSVLLRTGLKLKPALLDKVQINPEELTYHFLDYSSHDGYKVELYQPELEELYQPESEDSEEEEEEEDLIKNRIKVDQEIVLKLINDLDIPVFVKKDEILGMIFAVKRIYSTWNSRNDSRKYTIGSCSQQTTRACTINSQVINKET
jgi:hypothetical protein